MVSFLSHGFRIEQNRCSIYRREKYEISNLFWGDIRCFSFFRAPLVSFVFGAAGEPSLFRSRVRTLGCPIRYLDGAGDRSGESRFQHCRICRYSRTAFVQDLFAFALRQVVNESDALRIRISAHPEAVRQSVAVFSDSELPCY